MQKDFSPPQLRKEVTIPYVVPNSPTKGAVDAMVARLFTRFPMSSCTEEEERLEALRTDSRRLDERRGIAPFSDSLTFPA